MAPTARAPAVTAHLRCKRRVVRWEWALETAHCERMPEEREGGGKRGKAASIPQFLMPLRTNVLYNVLRVSLGARAPSPGGAAAEARTRIMAKVVVNLQEPLLPEPCAPDLPEAGVPVCFGLGAPKHTVRADSRAVSSLPVLTLFDCA